MRSAARLMTDSTSSILSKLSKSGFAHIEPSYYLGTLGTPYPQFDMKALQSSYKRLNLDPAPGNRYRAYTRYNWDTKQSKLVKDTDNNYFQSKKYNYADGGKIRVFDNIGEGFLNNPVIRYLLERNIALAQQSSVVNFADDLSVGLHQIRYRAEIQNTAYSSPIWLHKDDEPLVFVHLLSLTPNLLGGDNVLSQDAKSIDDIIRLTSPLETIVLTKKYLHAVTPMGSANDTPAYRDVLLVTFQNKPPTPELEEKEKAKKVRPPRPSSAGLFAVASSEPKKEEPATVYDVPAIHWAP
jgi:hypothetical protein